MIVGIDEPLLVITKIAALSSLARLSTSAEKKKGCRGTPFPSRAMSRYQPRHEPGRYFVRFDDVVGVTEVEPQSHL